ncbi:helix-turn-helix transcriptional regulator [Clostridium hydrogeniformans]|uniref:helix-turn-helix transcriptional regulator n=1 Tax=Clostridium hydrogeniformans TaxID=349933 RepID=UPI000481E804|nr:AraC family transcriptional regulator [Clostridium hydrogeniformans]
MDIFFNHGELCVKIVNQNLQDAINMYDKKVNIILHKDNNASHLKKFIYSMNTFIYTYIYIKSNISVSKLCKRNMDLIDNCYSKEELIKLGRNIVKSYIRTPKDNILTPQNSCIKKALFYIHSNLHKEITLAQVADYIHISRTYLCHLFKENTGYKFCDYINNARIVMAKEFLTNTNFNLDIVSLRCGFKSQSHFSTTFKKFENMTPNQYRKNTLLKISNIQ